MSINFKIRLSTIIIALLVISSAAYMRQLLNAVRYGIMLPETIAKSDFENEIIPNLEEGKHKRFMKKIYKPDNNSNTYKLQDMYGDRPIEENDKAKIMKFLRLAGYNDHMGILVWVIFALVGLVIIGMLIRLKLSVIRYILFAGAFGLGLLYALTINDHVEERIHLILFGIVGFMFARDNVADKRWFVLLFTLVYSLFVASVDEMFQYFLPYRFGDMHDVVFGTLGGIWGALICIIINLDIKKRSVIGRH